MAIRIGSLRHRVTIQRPASGQDSLGQPVDAPEVVAERWAAVEALRGRDLEAAQQIHAEATYRVRLRHMTGIEPKMQVVHGGQTLEIVGPPLDPDGRRRELHLLCRHIT